MLKKKIAPDIGKMLPNLTNISTWFIQGKNDQP